MADAPAAAADGWGAGLQIPQSEVLIEHQLAEGKYATVYKGTVYGQDVAIKVPKSDTERILNLFKKEGQTLSRVTHENVCRWLGYSLTESPDGKKGIMLITEYLTGGDLQQAIDAHRNKRTPLSLFTRLCLARDIICGMIIMHEHGYVHHDLKPANIMLNEHGRGVVCDLGFAVKRSKEPAKDSARGSLLWMAPEVMNHQPYNHQADVYSWAIIAWQLLTGAHEPYEQYRDPQTFVADVGRKGVRPPIPVECPAGFQTVLQDAWAASPNERPTFRQLLDRMNTVLIDTACPDPVARSFWRTTYPSQVSVQAKSFFESLYNFLQLPLPREPPKETRLSDRPLPDKPAILQLQQAKSNVLREWMKSSPACYARGVEELKRRDALERLVCFKSLILNSDPSEGGGVQQQVTLERWGKISTLFGPISADDPRAFFEKIRGVLRKPWYHGNVSREQAVAALTPTSAGTFLVRLSTNPLHSAVISLNVGRSVNHIQVNFEHGRGFSLLGKSQYFPSLQDLVQHYILNGPLKEVCPFVSPYAYTKTLYDESHAMVDSGYYLDTGYFLTDAASDAELCETLRKEPDVPAAPEET